MIERAITPEIVQVLEPLAFVVIAMAFSTKIRNWWMNVGDNECQYEYYDDEKGWQKCPREADHVHHIRPERWTKDRGGESDLNVGMPLCDRHHVRNKGEEEHSEDFSFHPDIASAYDSYHEWKKQQEHLLVIHGKKDKPRNSPFEEIGKEHREKSAKNERYWSGTEEIDDYYEDKMRNKAIRYIAETGNKKPKKKSRGKNHNK